ncbi:hypothetical protein N7495_000374 [Penicillium taxi]|uniref:uncharacterized protein n=1 Tax=Penicillium taxi TaxID=168475 RepID=UPI0025453C42|nr:uncharacterized protein N7495_000374 [Penicillium taxi]KAJ5907692.1 hypothetical protein N7495_000374 [Penicillium taxi]
MANSTDPSSPTRLEFDEKGQKQSMWHRLGFRRWLGHDRDTQDTQDENIPNSHNSLTDRNKQDKLTRRLSRRVGVGLPRPTTFKRQLSENRERLAPLQSDHRRAVSVDRRPQLSLAQRLRSPPPVGPRQSAPEVQWLGPPDIAANTAKDDESLSFLENEDVIDSTPEEEVPVPEQKVSPDTLEMELQHRWILNLSMHFRDRSAREKFFVTYAQNPTQWRRVTISCDYRDAQPDSLEHDLKEMRYQRDKCARIYEAIRESLPEIQFYDTVTNLKVETRDGRLHVHVTEDVNETIPYPPISSIRHLNARCVSENSLHLDSHLSGFVYKVSIGGRPYIKKEIPGPDTVDEFLYEINALHALIGAPNVIRVEGIVVDERQEKVKGLLIDYADQGALVDILYEERGEISFARRERWAFHIVRGLCEIHEAGYVQGDFTLANIVINADDNAHIIDINRRGCPVGWEPPEIAAKIESNQRISMYIGVKTDLYQLGMTLWALAMGEDEPERQPRPLMFPVHSYVPEYYRRVVDICLSPNPRRRMSARDLLMLFPQYLSFSTHRPQHLPDHPLIPLVTKGNDSIPEQIFLRHHDETKESTPTLAGSNREAKFLSRPSSASTLNQHESDSRIEELSVRGLQNLEPGSELSTESTGPQTVSDWINNDGSRPGPLTIDERVPPPSEPAVIEPSYSAESLFLSTLPINPSLQAQRYSLTNAMDTLPQATPSAPVTFDCGPIGHPSESKLPINPAIPLYPTNFDPASPVIECPLPKLPTLSDSCLPINPACREGPTHLS